MLGSPPAKNFHAGTQQLAQGRSGFAARHHSRRSPRAHLLHHSGENQLRAKFDFIGTPVRFVQRLRKRDDKSERDEKSSRGDQSSRRNKSRRGDKSSRGGKP